MPNDRREDETGTFSEKYTDADFIDAIESQDWPSAQSIADDVGCSYDTAYSRLQIMEENGLVTSQKISQARIWALPDG